MKLRYYLRGLGMGVLVTALVMGLAMRGRGQTLSDAQIRERALQMGMVDGSPTVLKDLQGSTAAGNASEASTESKASTGSTTASKPAGTDAGASGAGKPTGTAAGNASEASTESKASTGSTAASKPAGTDASASGAGKPTGTAAGNASEASTESKASTGSAAASKPAGADAGKPTVTIEIPRGSGSESVSRSLAAAGLVADAKAYDKYLCDNGYSQSLRVGSHEIPMGATEEEIAKIIATKR